MQDPDIGLILVKPQRRKRETDQEPDLPSFEEFFQNDGWSASQLSSTNPYYTRQG